MSTVDTSTWNSDPDLNESLEGIPLNADASISQAWQAFRILMAAAGKNGLTLTEKVSGPSSSVDEHIVLFDGASGLKLKDSGFSLSDIGANAFTGATASAAGTMGLVPAPQAGDQNKVLMGSGTWGAVAAASHSHGNITNAGAIGSTSGLPVVTGANGVLQAGNFGTAAGTVCEGNDSRLSNARTPTSHTHGSITNDGKLGTASRAVVTDDNKSVTVSSVTATELSYLSGVTSAVQTQLDGCVKTAGDQTVDGVKTFLRGFTQKLPNYERGFNSETLINHLVFFADKNDVAYGNIACTVNADKSSAIKLLAFDTTAATGGSLDYLGIGCTTSGAVITHAPTPAVSSNSTEIATTVWVRTYCETTKGFLSGTVPIANGGTGSTTKNFVDLSNDQSISGIKTFNSDIYIGTNGKLSSSGNLAKRNNTGSLILCGGTSAGVDNGSYIILNGSSSTDPGVIYIRTGKNSNSYGTLYLNPNGTLSWNGQPIQTGSDERIKTPLSSVPDAVLDAWESIQWGEFKFLDAVERKGEIARMHLGLIAQRVKAVFEERGLDACKYGILCHEVREAAGDEPAVDMWMVRYTEALAMEAICQRRRADRLEAQIAALEEAMNA